MKSFLTGVAFQRLNLVGSENPKDHSKVIYFSALPAYLRVPGTLACVSHGVQHMWEAYVGAGRITMYRHASLVQAGVHILNYWDVPERLTCTPYGVVILASRRSQDGVQIERVKEQSKYTDCVGRLLGCGNESYAPRCRSSSSGWP